MNKNEIRIGTVAGNRMDRPGWLAAAAAALGLAILLSVDIPTTEPGHALAANAECAGSAQSQRTTLAQPVKQCTDCDGDGPPVNFIAGC